MRVNIEDDLFASGRLGRLARTMGWTEREALGALVMVYRATQDAEIVEAPTDRLVTVCAAYFDDDAQAHAFFGAMIAARLAKVTGDGRVAICGNRQHVERLGKLRSIAASGGKARFMKSSMISEPHAKRELSWSLAHANDTQRHDNSSMISEPHAKRELSWSLAQPSPPTPTPAENINLGARSLAHASVSAQDAHALVEHWQDERAKRGRNRTLMAPTTWVDAAKAIIAQCKGDMAHARLVVSAYVASDHPYWSNTGWPLMTLLQPRDFERACLETAGKAPGVPQEARKRMTAASTKAMMQKVLYGDSVTNEATE